MMSNMFQCFNMPRFSWIMTECKNAVPVSQGMNAAISTGSQPQYPPQPSTSYAQRPPSTRPNERNSHAHNAQRRVRRIQRSSVRPVISAAIAKEYGITNETKPRYSIGGWMIIPGWRRSGFRPRPSSGVKRTLPAGWNVYSLTPSKVWYSCAKGFSKKTFIPMKNAIVTQATTITHGRNSRSRSHLRSVTSEANADINQDQKSSEPDCPPHQAVIFR